MKKVLMLASFGLEIVECGGALAAHIQSGDQVEAAVLMSKPESEPQILKAAGILGLEKVEFLHFPSGEYTTDAVWKEKIVELTRKTKPDIIITQDPVHAQHDLDPDRRTIALLYPESFALSGREWHIEECGGYSPHTIDNIYYMTPENPNCVVEISKFFGLKVKALGALKSQMQFSAQALLKGIPKEELKHIVENYDDLKDDPVALGLAMHTQFEKSIAIYHGLSGHSGAVFGEAYRREGMFVMEKLQG